MRLIAPAITLFLCSAPIAAQTTYIDSTTRKVTHVETAKPLPTILTDSTGTEKGTASNPLVVTGGTGGGGGGGGDASAANQATQIARETSIRDQIGALASPAAGSTNRLLTDLTTAQAGTTAALPARDANGDLRVPTMTVTPFRVELSANTSTELLGPSTTRTGYEVQCTGTADVTLSRVHATLTAALPTAGGGDWVIPAGAKPAYIPAYVSGAGVTAYTGTAQACWGVSYARQ